MRSLLHYAVLAGMILCTIACKSTQATLQPEWTYADLRYLDPEEPLKGAADLIAAYTRSNSKGLQLRLDFLDVNPSIDQDIILVLDSQPGGARELPDTIAPSIYTELAWDYLLFIQNEQSHLLDSQLQEDNNGTITVLRDPTLDTVTIDIQASFLTQRLGIQLYILENNSTTISDSTDPFFTDTHPPQRAQVLLVFWNTFQPATPALALRSWDGAHAGTQSSRHGLKNLLDAAEKNQAPVYILDLYTPSALSTLDYMGLTDRFQTLLDKNIIEIPNLNVTEQIDITFPDRQFQFSSLANCTLISGDVATDSGLNTDTKRALLASAINSQIVCLGGDFSNSSFGNPIAANASLYYLAHHPWIYLINPNEEAQANWIEEITLYPCWQLITNTPFQELTSSEFKNIYINHQAVRSLSMLPPNNLTVNALQILNQLLTVTSEEQCINNAPHIQQLGFILEGAKWAESPYDVTNCNKDIDWDGEPECILSNEHYFIAIDPNGGYIPFAFWLQNNGIHQMIGPEWQLIQEQKSDPDLFNGAFSDHTGESIKYSAMIPYPGKVILFSDNVSIRKSYALNSSGLQVTVENSPDLQLHIPIIIDPWIRYQPGWGNLLWSASPSQSSWVWGFDTSAIKITTNAQFTTRQFNSSHEYLSQPEDPNWDYTLGHYLPFPMAVIDIATQPMTQIEIIALP